MVEDLGQVSTAMLALKVFQSFPTQRKALLLEIGGVNA